MSDFFAANRDGGGAAGGAGGGAADGTHSGAANVSDNCLGGGALSGSGAEAGVRRGLDRGILKVIACAAMVVDHVGNGFFTAGSAEYYFSQFIGCITAPVLFYFIVEGYHHTRDVAKYARNLLIFAGLSYFPFIIYFYGSLNHESVFQLNVIYTLLLGLLVIHVRHSSLRLWVKILLIAILFILSTAGDWNYYAPLTILVFDVYYGNRRHQLVAYALIVIFFDYGVIANTFRYQFSSMFDSAFRVVRFDAEIYAQSWYILGLFIPLILLAFYNGRPGGSGHNRRAAVVAKWGFYIFYPAHLTVLALIKYLA
jgi:hypothetical protein